MSALTEFNSHFSLFQIFGKVKNIPIDFYVQCFFTLILKKQNSSTKKKELISLSAKEYLSKLVRLRGNFIKLLRFSQIIGKNQYICIPK